VGSCIRISHSLSQSSIHLDVRQNHVDDFHIPFYLLLLQVGMVKAEAGESVQFNVL
jgi:hypothetical protein